MFFYLSKIMMFLLTPIVWLIILLFTFLLVKKRKKLKKTALILFLSVFFITTNSFIVDEAFRAWEYKAVPDSQLDSIYEYGVVLGGVTWYDSKLDRLGIVRSYDRVIQAVELYKKGRIKKIFLSGGSGSIIDSEFKESLIVKEHLVRIGIPDSVIEYEFFSRNTHENASETLKRVGSKNKVLLITSAFHMKRAVGCFKKAGLEVTPYAVDRYSGPRKYVFDHMFIPNVDAISNWTLIIHEMTGYVIYSIMGYV